MGAAGGALRSSPKENGMGAPAGDGTAASPAVECLCRAARVSAGADSATSAAAFGPGLLAEDLPDLVPTVLRQLEHE